MVFQHAFGHIVRHLFTVCFVTSNRDSLTCRLTRGPLASSVTNDLAYTWMRGWKVPVVPCKAVAEALCGRASHWRIDRWLESCSLEGMFYFASLRSRQALAKHGKTLRFATFLFPTLFSPNSLSTLRGSYGKRKGRCLIRAPWARAILF